MGMELSMLQWRVDWGGETVQLESVGTTTMSLMASGEVAVDPNG